MLHKLTEVFGPSLLNKAVRINGICFNKEVVKGNKFTHGSTQAEALSSVAGNV